MNAFDEKSVRRSIGQELTASLLAGGFLLAGLGGWAANASLNGAVVAAGHFTVDSHVKKVQHPTGGVVGEILVREGQSVAAGEILMRLDQTQTRAQLGIVTRRLDELNARRTRLEAERDRASYISFPDELTVRSVDPDVAAAIDSERRLFLSRHEVREGRKAQLAERVLQYGHEIEGLEAQERAFTDGLAVLHDEIAALKGLREQRLVSFQRLNALETQAATFAGERGEKIAYKAQAAGRIAEARLQILQIDQDHQAEVGAELRDIQAEIGEFSERRIAAEDELRRIDIPAPQAGRIHEMSVHTVGGVISRGDTIMSIVPEGDSLALDARVLPQDIDQLHVGQAAILRLSAFNQRTTPELNGHVARVGADLTHDERTGLSWYAVRIEVPEKEIVRLGSLKLVPGMPAEALIGTGERTALSYLVKPLSDQINRAFREE